MNTLAAVGELQQRAAQERRTYSVHTHTENDAECCVVQARSEMLPSSQHYAKQTHLRVLDR